IGNALPLDELSRTSAVSIVLFVAVWSAAGLLLGWIAWAAGAERLTAAFLLALGVGAWTYLVTGTSILIVRQIPAHEAFDAAVRLRAVWLPAALAGFAAAITGRARAPASARAPPVLACAVAAAGLL